MSKSDSFIHISKPSPWLRRLIECPILWKELRWKSVPSLRCTTSTIPILVLPSHSLSSSFPTTTSVLPNRARTLCPLLKCEWTGEILLHAWWSLDQVGRSWSSTGHDVKKPTWNHFYSTSDSSKKDQAMWIHPYNHHIQSWHIERIVNKKSACHFIAA